MAQINVSLDTATRQCVLVIDGQVTPAETMYLSKYMDWEGKPGVAFEYVQRSQNAQGLDEIRGYRLPDPASDSQAKVNAHGLTERPVTDITKATRDIAQFFRRDQN